MDKVLERLVTEFANEESRYAYADTATNAFLTAQIKALREDRGLTQEELAELVGTKQSGISRWQNSGFSGCKVESLRKFAKAFGVRLRITFEEFGTLPTDVRGFTKERLAPRKFEDDPALTETAKNEPEGAIALYGTQVQRMPNDPPRLVGAGGLRQRSFVPIPRPQNEAIPPKKSTRRADSGLKDGFRVIVDLEFANG